MKEIKAGDLEVGDIYFYEDRYEVVISTDGWSARGKVIMAPTQTKIFRKIGDRYYLARNSKVKLLCRDGEQV